MLRLQEVILRSFLHNDRTIRKQRLLHNRPIHRLTIRHVRIPRRMVQQRHFLVICPTPVLAYLVLEGAASGLDFDELLEFVFVLLDEFFADCAVLEEDLHIFLGELDFSMAIPVGNIVERKVASDLREILGRRVFVVHIIPLAAFLSSAASFGVLHLGLQVEVPISVISDHLLRAALYRWHRDFLRQIDLSLLIHQHALCTSSLPQFYRL